MAKKQKSKKHYSRKLKSSSIFLPIAVVVFCCILIAYFLRLGKYIHFLNTTVEKTLLPIGNDSTLVYASESFRIPILMYHYVEDIRDTKDTIRISLNIPPSIFEEQIRSLQDGGYTFLTMKDISQLLVNKSAIPEKPIVLTFDDGYRDFYDIVLPLLKKYDVKAVAYISPGLLDSPNYMSRDQVIAVARSGIVEIAAHTVNHRFLANDTLADAYYEIYESKKVLEEMIQEQVVSFAYPFGAYDGQAIELVKRAGFKTAVSTEPGIEITGENIFSIPRIRPGIRVGEELREYLQQSTFIAY